MSKSAVPRSKRNSLINIDSLREDFSMLTRRHLFAGSGAVVGALALATMITGAATAAEIKVLNWQGYGTDEKWAIEAFEKKTGIKVTHDYFNSEQEMLTKLSTAPGTYDVVLMNNIYVPEAAKEGLIQPIDEKKISNFADLTPSLRDSDRFVMDGKHMAISWVWGLTSFAYNTELVQAGARQHLGHLWTTASSRSS